MKVLGKASVVLSSADVQKLEKAAVVLEQVSYHYRGTEFGKYVNSTYDDIGVIASTLTPQDKQVENKEQANECAGDSM